MSYKQPTIDAPAPIDMTEQLRKANEATFPVWKVQYWTDDLSFTASLYVGANDRIEAETFSRLYMSRVWDYRLEPNAVTQVPFWATECGVLHTDEVER